MTDSLPLPGSLLEPWFSSGEKQALNKVASYINDKGITPVLNYATTLSSNLASGNSTKGSTLIGYQNSYTGSVLRTARNKFSESLSLADFGAVGDGVTDDTTAVKNWLTACHTYGKKGYAEAGTYLISGIYMLSVLDIHIECHGSAIFKGKLSYQDFNGTGATGQQFTITAFTNTGAGTFAAESVVTATNVHSTLTAGTHYTIAGNVITMAGANTIPVGSYIHVVSTDAMIDLHSTGGVSSPANRFFWSGGRFDASLRGSIGSAASGSGLAVNTFNKVTLFSTEFYGSATYAAASLGISDSGFTPLGCNNITVMACVFQGWGDLGIYATGGGLTNNTDDGAGLAIIGNHFIECAAAWKAARRIGNVNVQGNTYDRCWIGGNLWPASNIEAGRGMITGEVFRRCGRNCINVWLQTGCIVSDILIIDPGYLSDGVTAASPYNGVGSTIDLVCITVYGCQYTKVSNINICYVDLAPPAIMVGVHAADYLFNSINYLNNNNSFHDCDMQGLSIGFKESGVASVGNKYRNNEFRSVTTEYSGVPTIAGSSESGVTTPTVLMLGNLDAATACTLNWQRYRNTVRCWGTVTLDATAAASTYTEARIPLPVATTFANTSELAGVATSGINSDLPAKIFALVGGSQARLAYSSLQTVPVSWSFDFTYTVK